MRYVYLMTFWWGVNCSTTPFSNERVLSVPVGEEIRARVDLHQPKPYTPPPPPPPPIQAPMYHMPPIHDGILNRQAAEIEQQIGRASCRERVLTGV